MGMDFFEILSCKCIIVKSPQMTKKSPPVAIQRELVNYIL
jgi:hypothetical protein